MVNRKLHPKKFFTEEEKKRIVQAIQAAERQSSGEIRVVLEKKGRGEIFPRAKKFFEKLRMTQTQHRNGVLIYLSLHSRSFALLGDKGIHEKMGDDFWKDVTLTMQSAFTRGDFLRGLEQGLRQIGEKLKLHFPKRPGDINELPDEVTE